jgi:ferredoxin-NADP reductase
VKSFRFEVPRGHRARIAKAGQHIVVQARVGSATIQRSYTLTSSVTARDHYEITVKCEPHGTMSRWLFENMRPGVTLAILPPSGSCAFELSDPRPLVCLVAGIGITPALGICRSAAASGVKRRIHVDYSASSRAEMVCGDELHALTSSHDTITFRARITREDGRFLRLAQTLSAVRLRPLFCESGRQGLPIETLLMTPHRSDDTGRLGGECHPYDIRMGTAQHLLQPYAHPCARGCQMRVVVRLCLGWRDVANRLQ